eukprot:scaffold46723_cov56-Phaeocystis_antarctica.AAC.3
MATGGIRSVVSAYAFRSSRRSRASHPRQAATTSWHFHPQTWRTALPPIRARCLRAAAASRLCAARRCPWYCPPSSRRASTTRSLGLLMCELSAPCSSSRRCRRRTSAS